MVAELKTESWFDSVVGMVMVMATSASARRRRRAVSARGVHVKVTTDGTASRFATREAVATSSSGQGGFAVSMTVTFLVAAPAG